MSKSILGKRMIFDVGFVAFIIEYLQKIFVIDSLIIDCKFSISFDICNNGKQIFAYDNKKLPDSNTHIHVRIKDETIWLTQQQMVILFKSSKSNVSEHLKNIFSEGELDSFSTVLTMLDRRNTSASGS